MGTKSKPGKFDCYANAHPDEPMFILLGRDPGAAELVEAWAARREAERGPSAKVEEARECARAMRKWRESGRPSDVIIIVNGEAKQVHPAESLTYERIRGLAAMTGTPSLTWKTENASGIMYPGAGGLVPQEGMSFHVCHTGNG